MLQTGLFPPYRSVRTWKERPPDLVVAPFSEAYGTRTVLLLTLCAPTLTTPAVRHITLLTFPHHLKALLYAPLTDPHCRRSHHSHTRRWPAPHTLPWTTTPSSRVQQTGMSMTRTAWFLRTRKVCCGIGRYCSRALWGRCHSRDRCSTSTRTISSATWCRSTRPVSNTPTTPSCPHQNHLRQ